MSIIENKLSFCKQFESADWNKKRKRSNIKFVMFRFLVFSNSRDISEILIQKLFCQNFHWSVESRDSTGN